MTGNEHPTPTNARVTEAQEAAQFELNSALEFGDCARAERIQTIMDHLNASHRALRRLANEVGGLKAFEPEVRQAIGNTNWAVLQERLAVADGLLSCPSQERVS